MCGVNGETYSSTCAADSARVVVDYRGRCRAVGVGDGEYICIPHYCAGFVKKQFSTVLI